MTVRIYKLTRGCDVWHWLCDAHLAKRLADPGTTKSAEKDPPHELPYCGDCHLEAIDRLEADIDAAASALGLDAMEAAE